MAETTITEALAELKTLEARIVKKRAFVVSNLGRQKKYEDPLVKDGGSSEVIARERQAIRDLEGRGVMIRAAITKANQATEIEVEGFRRPIHEWLIWRREVAKNQKAFLDQISSSVRSIRHTAQT